MNIEEHSNIVIWVIGSFLSILFLVATFCGEPGLKIIILFFLHNYWILRLFGIMLIVSVIMVVGGIITFPINPITLEIGTFLIILCALMLFTVIFGWIVSGFGMILNEILF